MPVVLFVGYIWSDQTALGWSRTDRGEDKSGSWEISRGCYSWLCDVLCCRWYGRSRSYVPILLEVFQGCKLKLIFTVQSLYKTSCYNMAIDGTRSCCVSQKILHGILQRNYRKLTIKLIFSVQSLYNTPQNNMNLDIYSYVVSLKFFYHLWNGHFLIISF